MSLYHKLKLLVFATAEEPARKLVEMNDVKIFEQEIIDVERAIKSVKLHLAHVKAEAKSLAHSIDELTAKTNLREKQTLEAMDKDEELAYDLASLVAEDETSIQDQKRQLTHLNQLESKLTSDLKKAVRSIQSHQRQVQILKANQYSQAGINSLSQNQPSLNGTLRELNNSLSNIKQRQLRNTYLDEAEGEVEITLSGNGLDERLAASGIRSGKHDGNAVLDRLKLLKSAS